MKRAGGGVYFSTDVLLLKGTSVKLPTIPVRTPYDKQTLEAKTLESFYKKFLNKGYAFVLLIPDPPGRGLQQLPGLRGHSEYRREQLRRDHLDGRREQHPPLAAHPSHGVMPILPIES